LFPYCPESLFEDLNETLSADRRFFGRSGEIAYLMLTRSGCGDQIWEGLRTVFFDKATHSVRWKKAIASLAHNTDLDTRSSHAEQPLGYLPYESHRVFGIFGEDVKTLLNAGLPEYDVMPYLARLIAFHLLHYVLVIAAEGLEDRPSTFPPVTYVLEIQSERADVTRRLARNSFQLNNELPMRRIQTALSRIRRLDEVDDAISRNDRQQLELLLENRWWMAIRKKPDARRAISAPELWSAFEKAVKKRHRQHLGRVHHEYARSCGLSSRAGTNAYRYAPTDGFLRTMVLANVSRRMDYDEFLDVLYRRYGFIIAKGHAQDSGLGGDLTDFDLNNRRFQARLTRLGLMHRLSDACAYVVNRYREEG